MICINLLKMKFWVLVWLSGMRRRPHAAGSPSAFLSVSAVSPMKAEKWNPGTGVKGDLDLFKDFPCLSSKRSSWLQKGRLWRRKEMEAGDGQTCRRFSMLRPWCSHSSHSAKPPAGGPSGPPCLGILEVSACWYCGGGKGAMTNTAGEQLILYQNNCSYINYLYAWFETF